MKKVLCLIDSMGSGGAQRQMAGLASLLHTSGYNVKVFWYHSEDFYMDVLKSNGVECSSKVLRGPICKMVGVLKEILRFRPDTVISYLDGPCMISCILKMLGLRYNLIVSERNTTQNLSFKERIKFILYKFAAYIVPNSVSQKKYIETNYPSLTGKVKIITNFVDVDKFSPIPVERSQQEIKMLVVARLVEQKNVVDFIKSLRKVIDEGVSLRVDWYGIPFDEKYFNLCVNTVKDLGLNDVISFNGEVKDVVSVYRSADVFCLPSLYEGFPNTLCEAMSCGLPILCSRVCDNPYIVNENQNAILFDPMSHDDMADAILKFCKMPVEQREGMGQRSRQIAEEIFSLDVFLKKYESII